MFDKRSLKLFLSIKQIIIMTKHTLITHFDETSYRTLYDVLNYDSSERINHIPYGRVSDDIRRVGDTLPLHITVSSSTESLDEVMSRLEGLAFTSFDVYVDGIGLSPGKENSHFLYFKIRQCEEMDALLAELYKRIGNEKYHPEKANLHLTICISKDIDKIHRITARIKQQFIPFRLRIMSLGLYEIWPGVLKSIYCSC